MNHLCPSIAWIRGTRIELYSDDSAQDLHSMALMGNAEIVVAGQQDKILSINMIRGIVTKKVRYHSLSL